MTVLRDEIAGFQPGVGVFCVPKRPALEAPGSTRSLILKKRALEGSGVVSETLRAEA
jgi:hypothetical protein